MALSGASRRKQTPSSPGALPANFNSKQGNEKIDMPDHIREKLAEYYAEEIKACAEVFGGHAVKWREKRLGSRA